MIANAGRAIIVSDRAPIAFVERAGRLHTSRGGGGVVTALRDLGRLTPITWLAGASAAADLRAAARRLEHGGLFGVGRLALRPVPLGQEAQILRKQFSDRVLWFAQHGIWDLRLEPESPERIRWLFTRYRAASRAFSDAAASELHRPGHGRIVLVHDYQLYSVPAQIRARSAGARISHFTHIPWPPLASWLQAVPRDVVATLVRDLLAADVAHFQTDASARAFLECVDALIPGAKIRDGWIDHAAGRTLVRARPVSVDPSVLRAPSSLVARLRADPRALIVRIDRADPIKNVPAGFVAFERLLELRPELVGRVRFRARVQPTRVGLLEYAFEIEEVRRLARRINERFGSGTVALVERADRAQALAELAAADVVLVNSRADGMNLVAKEAAVLNRRLALVLSRTAGAYRELAEGAIGVEPSDIAATTAALGQALDMPEAERARRADAMRRRVLRWTAADWLNAQLADLAETRPDVPLPASRTVTSVA